MVKFGIISDTHISENDDPIKVQNLINQLKESFKDVDNIIHCGDILDGRFLLELERIAPLKCVKGNMDFIEGLPNFLKFPVGKYNIGVIHELPEERESFVTENALHILIYGHTHQPLIESTPYNVLLINPGSPTYPKTPPQKRGFAKPFPRSTVITLAIDENDILTTFIITLKL